MAYIFDGKAYAREKELDLKKLTRRLKDLGIKPRLASVLVGTDPASVLYVDLKKQAAERIGAIVDIYRYEDKIQPRQLVGEIEKFNQDKSVHGIMIQLPLPEDFLEREKKGILTSIAKVKDVDGLRENSDYLAPTVKAVLEIIKETSQCCPAKPIKVVVVGAKGSEGKKIYKVLKDMEYDIDGYDKDANNLGMKTRAADILISVTGSPGILGKKDIKKGAVVIDVGSPKGDIRGQEAAEVASFLTPVPGGVGPVTIGCLLENLIESAESLQSK